MLCFDSDHIYAFALHNLDFIQVRKEKLGDRIAALQQLVAPFGKVKLSFSAFYQSNGQIIAQILDPSHNLNLYRFSETNLYCSHRSFSHKTFINNNFK